MNQYRRFGQPVFLLFLFLYSNTTFAQSKSTLRLFMIGNSFSQNASRYLPQLSKEGGHELLIGRAEIGGSSLQRHWGHVEAFEKNPDDPNGKPYGGKSLKELLATGIWDVVTIQQNSLNSGDVDTYRPYAQKLYEYVHKLQPKATIVFHETWAYRSDSKDFSRIAPGDTAKNAEQMWEKLRAAYQTIANELSMPVIPNGDAFWQMNAKSKWAYRKDSSFDPKTAQVPALPNQTNSLHVGYRWDDKGKLAFDSHHANAAGCYLGGLVWYSFLFNESPVALNFKPEEVSDDFAKQLKKTAWKTVKRERKKSKYTWAGVQQ